MNNHNTIISRTDYIVKLVSILTSIFVIAAIIIDYGFELDAYEMSFILSVYNIGWWVYFISFAYNVVVHWKAVWRKRISFTLILGIMLCTSALPRFFNIPGDSQTLAVLWSFLIHKYFIISVIGLLSLITISQWIVNFVNKRTNPALLIVVCFIMVIVFGTLLLMLPRSTLDHIRLPMVDALFVSTSAVCVTGLSTIEIAHTFTMEGQIIIALLIQIGGLGIMTITSFFALFFMDGIGLYSQFSLKNMIASSSASLKSVLINVIGFTFVIEIFGIFFIWFSIHSSMGMTFYDEIFFSLFHSVSAFCNAGFSTLEGNLGNDLILFNHNSFYLVISLLIVLGGIGFPILMNLKRILSYYVSELFHKVFKRNGHRPRYIHIADINTKIVLYSTLALILLGAIGIALFEWNGSFTSFSASEKIVQSLFNAVAPRTAGFNSVAISDFSRVTIILYLALMWIGGGSQSTAGGIKVNTFVVALASFKSLIKGEHSTTLFNREITYSSIRRTLVVVFGSICIIALFYIALLLLEPNIPSIDLFFECVSAFSTVGASLGITPFLGNISKILLVVLMFLGRVGFITVLMSILPQKEQPKYRLPKEEIIIN
ncbi:MAG: potassium transporter [Muribaculaceae bacterium]|nr:potassium transporter [Muribaculaceae bacterium]